MTHRDDRIDRILDEPAEHRRVGDRDLTRWPSPAGRTVLAVTRRVRHHLAPHQVLVVTLLVGFALTAALTALAGAVYESVTDSDGVAVLDQPALRAAIAARTPLGNQIVTAYTNLGGTVGMPLLAAAFAVGLALRWRRWTPVVLIAATAAGSLTLTVIGKAVVGRTRPPLADAVPPFEYGASFPSGHTLSSVAIAGVVAYLLVREQRSHRARALTVSAASAFAVTMGLSRVYLGHHWLSDVLVAWTLGLAWLTVVVVTHRLFLTVRAAG